MAGSTAALRFFGTDGIRDVARQGRLSPENVARAGRALVRCVRAWGGIDRPVRVLLARDPRPSGAALVGHLAAHMAAEGAEVGDAGVLPSPALAWLTVAEGYDLGCSVSASHNPAHYNGIKPFLRDGRKLGVDEEREVEACMERVDPRPVAGAPTPDGGAASRYVARTAAWLRARGSLEGLALVVDLSAGAASATAPGVLEALGARASYLHPAGSRPINDGCGSEHPEAWLDAVRAAGADAGLAFDGDADRVLLADESGALLDGDDLLAILAADRAASGGLPGGTVVSTVMANLGLEEFLGARGLALDRTPVGDRHVAERMRALGAEVGGEPAGHVVLPRDDVGPPGCAPALIGDGLVAGVLVLLAARRAGEALSVLRSRRPRHPQVLLNVRMERRRPLDDWPAFQHELGVQERALAGAGRLVVRYSGTEPLLRIMAEGRDEAAVRAAVEALARVARAP